MRKLKRGLSVLLAFLLIITSIPIQTSAEETKQDGVVTNSVENSENSVNKEMKIPEYKKEKKELIDKRGKQIEIFQNEDGTYTKNYYFSPIFHSGKEKKLERISNKLITSENNTLKSESTSLQTEFQPVMKNGKYATVSMENYQLQYQFQGADGEEKFTTPSKVEAITNENKITYKNSIPGVDIRNAVFDTQLKEDIILTKYNGFSDFHFFVQTTLKASKQEDGSIQLKDGEKVIFTLPKPFMTDSNINSQSGEAQRSDKVEYEINPVSEGFEITVKADQDWLKDSSRKFPVYIDPTVDYQDESLDTFITSAYPTTTNEKFYDSNLGYYVLKVGYYDSTTGTNYSYFQQDVSDLKGATINSATFSAKVAHSYYPTTATPVYLNEVGQAWSPTSLTWNNKPFTSDIIATASVYKDQWANFDITNTVKKWLTGTANNGLVFHENGNGMTYWKKFYASENSVDLQPKITVSYQYAAPSTPTGTMTSNLNGSETGYATINWGAASGATSYDILMFNGSTYERVGTTTGTSWTTKNKGIWPTSEEIEEGIYELHNEKDTQKGTELASDPSLVYANAGTKYASDPKYYFKIIAKYPTGYESPQSAGLSLKMPLDKPKAPTAHAQPNLTETQSGYVQLDWEPVQNATGYKVEIFNGKTYDEFDVGNQTEWTTQGKGIWPTATDITSGIYQLHHDGLGTELAVDPSPVYTKAGGDAAKKNYSFRVKAYSTNGFANSPSTDEVTASIQSPANLLGTEDYWTMIPVSFGEVNAATGNFVLDETDLTLTGRGPSIDITRTYNSQDASVGLFGTGWSSSLEVSVKEETNGDILYTEEDKTIHRFKKMSDGSYQAPLGIDSTFKKVNGLLILTDKDQTVTNFNANGKISSVVDEYGQAITYNYTDGILTSVSGSNNHTLTLEYRDGKISKITGPENRVVSYTYSGNDLATSTTPRGKVYRYGYENGKLAYVYDPKHTEAVPYKTLYVYQDDKFSKSIDPLGKETSFFFDPAKREVTVTKPKGNKDVYGYSLAGNPTYEKEDAGNLALTTTFEYENNLLKKKTDPKDQGQRVSESYQYDGKGNIIAASDAVGTDTYQYNSNNDVTKITDSENKTTSVTYEGQNAVSTTDEQANMASVTEYDAYGNPISGSQELAPGENLLTNGSFEDGVTNWSKEIVNNTADVSTYALSVPGSPGLGGNQAIRLALKPTSTGWGVVQSVQTVDGKPNTTYTFSAIAKTQNVTNAKVFLEIALISSSGTATHLTTKYSAFEGTHDWTKQQITFKTLSDTAKIKVYVVLSQSTQDATGSAWFDQVHLEEGAVSSSFNPVVNSSFENIGSGITGWALSTGNPGEIGAGFQGDNAIQIRRASTTSADWHFYQSVPINQTTASPLTVTAMSKADNAKNTLGTLTDDAYGIWIYADYSDGTSDWFVLHFPLGTKEWNRGALTIPKKKPVKAIRLYPLFRGNNTGTVWYDDIRIIEGDLLTKQTYNPNDNLSSSADEEGRTTSFTYDEYGNQTSVTDPMGYQKSQEYNLDNQLTKTILPNQTSVSYQYDDNGNTTQKTITANGNSQVVKYEYDVDNKITRFIDPLNRQINHVYDANANLIKTTMPNGSILEWTYDTADRVKELKRNGAVAFTYEYDANGNETKVTDSVNSLTRTKQYDSGNRITSMTDRGGTVSWSYVQGSDKLNSLNIVQGTVNKTTTFEYNVLNQNTKVTDEGKSYYFDYDEFGNVATYQTGNSVATRFGYDATQKVTDINIAKSDGTVLSSEKYGYDANGNRTSVESITSTGSTKRTYTFDSINQLTKETWADGTVNDYTYDGFGNRTSVKVTKPGASPVTTTETFNTGNQITSFGNEAITYDANGNRLSDGQFTYTWNEGDQLIAVTRKGETTAFATYKYDDDGRRIEKTVNGTTTRYYYDGDSINVLYETDANGTILRQYVYNADGIRMAMKSQGQILYYHYNPHGDVIAMTDQSGNVVAKYEYDAWGNVISPSVTGIAADNPFGYAGYMYDKETGLYYLMARYYHPKHGVFISMDPDPGDEDDPITQNGYAYADNNPVMNVDPDGNWAVDVAFLAYDAYQFKKNPSWKNAGWVALSAACFIDPTGLGSGAAHAERVSHAVYELVKGGKTVYVGRTRNIRAREVAHKMLNGDADFVPRKKGLSYAQARGLEHRLYLKNGGKSNLRNKIRPISKKNKKYKYYMSVSRSVYRR